MKAPVLAAAALILGAALPLPAAETAGQLITRARAYLGSETALKAVSTIHFTGRLEGTEHVPSPDDKTKLIDRPVSLPIDIIFQKPFQQQITMTRPEEIETTALDGYDAWQRRTNAKNPTQWQVTLLDAGQIKRLRANTWENLNFYAGLEKAGGQVEPGGDATVDGVACTKVSFVHDRGIVFVRYFEKATGRLVKTETETGAEIREEGEMIVQGVRFPRKVISKSPNGQTMTITFDGVKLNEKIPASQFSVPALRPN